MVTTYKANPNFKNRPKPVNGIIIHSMGEYIGGQPASDFLESLGLSAHYLINVDGSITKCVEPEKQAYHAGKSKWKGEEHLNKSFIGIEILVEGDHTYDSFLQAIKNPDTFNSLQYEACLNLCRILMSRFNIDKENIVRHSDVSGINVRPDPKQDVGSGFEWNKFKLLL